MANTVASGLIGNVVGGPTIQLPEVPDFTNEYAGHFDGVNDYMEVTPSPAMDLYGFSCWFKPDSIISASSGPGNVLLGQGGTSYFCALGGNITGAFTNEIITIRVSATNCFAWEDATATISTDWHHLAAAWSTSSATNPGGDGYDLYLDGVKVGNAAGSSPPSSPYSLSSAFRVGQRANGAYAFAGLMDEVAIFDSTVSSSDVATIYNSGTPGDLTDLSPAGWWRMGDIVGGSGTSIPDQGGEENDGTLNGATFTTDVPT